MPTQSPPIQPSPTQPGPVRSAETSRRSPGTIALGRIAGVPIGVHWSLLIIGTLLGVSLANGTLESQFPGYGTDTYAITAAIGVLLFFAAVLAHEVAHALMARRFGVETEGIDLWILGGVARLTSEPPTPRADAAIAAAGPAASLVCAAGFLAVGYGLDAIDAPGVLAPMLGWLGIVNIVLAVFNLLPASPLDGGRILRAALWARSNDRDSAGIVAAKVGKVLGVA
ncbi:MAG: site-2 protease family protein, partial [Acidimicrobiia bacterium]